jgi:hypothetical protein
MTEKEIIRKIYRKLDGELSDADKSDLENYLSAHPDAAQFSGESELIKKHFHHWQKDQVEIDLKPEILKKINMETYKQPPKKDGISIVRSFWTQPVFRFGFTFVLGVFAGFLIFSVARVNFYGADGPADEMKGTFYDSRSFDSMKTADILQFDCPQAKAICNVRYSTKIVEVRVDISSSGPVKSTIEFDYNDLALLNVQNVSVNDQSTAMAGGNFIQINNVGDNKFIFQLLNKNSLPHDITFKIYQNDSPIYQNAVQVNKE